MVKSIWISDDGVWKYGKMWLKLKKNIESFVLQLQNSYICENVKVMGTKEKLIERFKSLPKDFNWDELVRLFFIFGYKIDNKGKTSGSRVIFAKGESSYIAHKPHPGSIVKEYVMKQVLEFLTKNKLI